MDISVVIPLYNEDESLPELYNWIERVMTQNNFTFEVIFVNDGSTDHSWDVITELAARSEHVKGIKFRRNYGKSPALYCGFKEAQGDVVITMDADLQDSPDEIPELYRMIKEQGYDLVSGYKQNRSQGDPLSKTIPTKLFNATTRKVSGIKNLHDFNCGLKAYRRDVVKNIEVFGEMHRFIPYLAKNAGFDKIGEKPVHHQARKFGKSKFMGWNRFVNGYLDLMTLWFLGTFGKKPMHVFGFLGTIVFIIGFFAAFFLGVEKAWALYRGIPMRLITDSTYFYIALTMMMIGTQLFLEGMPVFSNSNFYPAQYLGKKASVTNSIVSNGCSIKGSVTHSILGSGVQIGEGAVIEDAILLPGSRIGKNCRIKKAIINEGVHILPDSVIEDPDGQILVIGANSKFAG